MAEADQVKAALDAARAAAAQAQDARVAGHAALRSARSATEQAFRSGDRAAQAAARRALAAAEEERGAADAALGAARERLAGVLDTARALDPRVLVGRLSADRPLLLFPVRIETRFGESPPVPGAVQGPQLWVRVFPDTCSVDAFGPDLTETEVGDAQDYWVAVWAAAGDVAGERNAWNALATDHGSGRAAWLITAVVPNNPGDRPASATDPQTVPTFDPVPTVPSTWNRAPRAVLLPEHFVLVLEEDGVTTEHVGLPVPPEVFTGPDPLASAEEQPHPVGGHLEMPDQLAWMVDFDRAVTDGLGFRIDLDGAQARRGFDRAWVVGVRSLPEPEESAAGLATLLEHHRWSRSGLQLVAQGTPTNNTEDSPSGHSSLDDPDVSFDALRAGPVPLAADPRLRPDGQWFAELLGIDAAVLDGVPGAHGGDQRDARAMQALLWPATMGYLLGTKLEPVMSDATVEHARWFFTRHVRGRGSVPAFRVGRQPYGITTTTAFSRAGRQRPRPVREGGSRDQFLTRLDALLGLLDDDWDALVATVPTLGRGGAPVTDAHATLLGVLGLHPTSVEYHYRYAEGFEQLVNRAGLVGFAEAFYSAVLKASLDGPAIALLERLGHTGDRPPLLDLYLEGREAPLAGPLIDDRPLSETEPVRVWATGERNYLQWLHDAARSSLDAVRTTTGFLDGAPDTLLFLLARHAVVLGFAEGSRRLHVLANRPTDELRALRLEPAFVHVNPDGPSESRYAPLYRSSPDLTPGSDLSVAAYLVDRLRVSPGAQVLREQVDALEVLAGASTARLERVLAEHLDTVSYRFDAWRLGLVSHQLELMRGIPQDPVPDQPDQPGDANGDGGDVPVTLPGVHVGAYGWLEDVRPKLRPLLPVELPDDLAEAFADGPALRRDPANGGHLLAPSLNQAVTASVLRSGYLAHATPAEPDQFSVNLSSERVRKALDLLSGMRQGQALGELLGYALERGLHDASGFAEVDEFILDLRVAFPLRARRLRSAAAPEGTPIADLEARNVVDGLRLVEHIDSTGQASYPFGLPALPGASPAQRAAIDTEVDRIRDLRDAVADLVLAESVHQATQGSASRAGAALRSVETGHHPPEIEVVRTPATGTSLTFRVGVHLNPAASAGAGATPRAIAAPAVDALLTGLLPALGGVGCRVRWEDPVDGTPHTADVTLAQLGLRPVDVVELLRTDDPAMAELDDRVLSRVRSTTTPRPDAELRIAYREAAPGVLPVAHVASQVAHLRAMLAASRPLRASDVIPPGEATDTLDRDAVAALAPFQTIAGTATTLLTDAQTFLTSWDALLADTTANLPAILAGTDSAVDDAVALLERGARLTVPGSGWGQAEASRGAQYARTVARLAERADAWAARLTHVDTLLSDYDGLPAATPDEERLAALAVIEAQIAPALADPAATPAAQRLAVGTQRDAFAAHLAGLRAVAAGSAPGLVPLLAAVEAQLPFTDVDASPFELDTTRTAMLTLVQDVVASVRSLATGLTRRTTAAEDAFVAHAAAADAPARLAAVTQAGEALLGEGFRVVPAFTVPAPSAAEWDQALAGVGGLLGHLLASGRDLPVEDWLHSAARVREPVRHLEQAGLLAGGYGLAETELVPVQLPHRPGDSWLAMEYPDTQDLTGEHLLYTAVYPPAFDPAGQVAGLLLDEWTEVLPGTTATAGLAFHYDQPSSEAPQSLLLVTPATPGRTWTWLDVRDAVPDTMRLARQRAVEPVALDQGAAARFLPATISAFTRRGISIGLTYAVNNHLVQELADD